MQCFQWCIWIHFNEGYSFLVWLLSQHVSSYCSDERPFLLYKSICYSNWKFVEGVQQTENFGGIKSFPKNISVIWQWMYYGYNIISLRNQNDCHLSSLKPVKLVLPRQAEHFRGIESFPKNWVCWISATAWLSHMTDPNCWEITLYQKICYAYGSRSVVNITN